jgi:hypothetical protein
MSQYMRLSSRPLSQEHVAAIVALFGWAIPDEGGVDNPRTESSLLSNGLGGSLLLARVVCGLHGSVKKMIWNVRGLN